MHPIVEKMKERYPNPMSVDDPSYTGQGYCVGGALCRLVHTDPIFDFPDTDSIAEALRAVNPQLHATSATDPAMNYADYIIYTNDRGDYDAAIALVDEALTWPQSDALLTRYDKGEMED